MNPLTLQNNKNLNTVIQTEGCCYLTCIAMPQIYFGRTLSVAQINLLWDIAMAEGIVDKHGYVKNVIRCIKLPIIYHMIDGLFPIVLLSTKKRAAPRLPLNPVPATVVFYQLQIQDGTKEHFVLFYADTSLAYNPKPDYMIVGNNTYWYYGFVK